MNPRYQAYIDQVWNGFVPNWSSAIGADYVIWLDGKWREYFQTTYGTKVPYGITKSDHMSFDKWLCGAIDKIK